MAEAKNGGEISPDKLAQGFGLIIAYICPGFLALIGLQDRFPSVKAWLGTAAAANTQAGSFLFAVMGALAVSMLLWSIGSFLIEDVLTSWLKWLKLPERSSFSEDARKQPGIESAYRDLRDQHYRYYQFHASMLVVVPLVYLDWISQFKLSDVWYLTVIITLVVIFVEFVFGHSAYIQLKRYRERRLSLLASLDKKPETE
jgi:hypothetical protein